jgi:hypothetical protein
LGSEDGREVGAGLDPERLLDLAARLVLAGMAPSVVRLARGYPCPEHQVRACRAELLDQKLWPYRVWSIRSASRPDPSEVLAARQRLGLGHDQGPVVAQPVTPAGLACAEYRREWIEGKNFLARWSPTPSDEEDS